MYNLQAATTLTLTGTIYHLEGPTLGEQHDWVGHPFDWNGLCVGWS